MKHFYAIAAASLMGAVTALAQGVPEPSEFSDYTGTSFNANWTGAGETYLSVFSLDAARPLVETQDFSSIIKDGRIDQEAAAALRPEWDVQTSGDGSGNVCYVLDKDMLTLDGNGSSVTLISRKGFLKTFKVKAYLVKAEGVTEENSSRFTLDILYNDGSRYGYTGSVYSMAFAFKNEYDFMEQFIAQGETSTISGIRIAVEKDDIHNVGDISIESISYDYDGRDYLFQNKPVSGETHLVENCDPSKAYFYYLSDATGVDQSRIVVADGFMLPALMEPELTSTTSYVAKWDTPYKANAITVRNYKVKIFDEPTVRYILNEDFDTVDKGTLELPEYTSDLDQYCNTPGWSVAGAAGRLAEGMIGTAASTRPWPPMGGYMYSPALDLSGCNGVYTLSLKLHGEPGDIISVYRDGSMTSDYTLYGHQFTFDDNGVIEEEYTMDDGVEGKSIRFESKGKKQFFIDYFRVAQTMAAGSVAYELESEVELSGADTSCEFFDLEENGVYAYGLTVYGTQLNTYERLLKHDEFKHVDLSLSGVEEVAYEGALTSVSASVGMVDVVAGADCSVAVYSFDGVVLGSAYVKAGASASIPVASGTPVIVRAGETAVKLVVK